MKMPSLEELSAPSAPLLFRTWILIWQHLPLVVFADAVLFLAALPALAVWLLGLTVPAIWVAALTLGPVWAGMSACTNRLMRGEEVSWHALLKETGHHWRTGVAISAVPALVVTLLFGTWDVLATYPRMNWLYLPLFVDGCMATCVALACLSVFALATSCPLRGWRLWKVALAVTTQRPADLLGTLALFMGAGLLLVWFNVGLLSLLCAPFAFCLAARTWRIRMDVLAREV
jgi:hypothetical protein